MAGARKAAVAFRARAPPNQASPVPVRCSVAGAESDCDASGVGQLQGHVLVRARFVSVLRRDRITDFELEIGRKQHPLRAKLHRHQRAGGGLDNQGRHLDADSHIDLLHRTGRGVDRRQVQAAGAISRHRRIPATRTGGRRPSGTPAASRSTIVVLPATLAISMAYRYESPATVEGAATSADLVACLQFEALLHQEPRRSDFDHVLVDGDGGILHPVPYVDRANCTGHGECPGHIRRGGRTIRRILALLAAGPLCECRRGGDDENCQSR